MGGSVGWSIVPYTERVQVQSPVRNIPRLWVQGAHGRQLIHVYLSLPSPSSLSKINEHILGWGFFKNPSSSNKAPPFIGKMLKRVSLAAQDRRANTTLWLNLWSKRPHMPKAGNTSAEQLITKQYSRIVSKPELWNPSWPQNKFTKEFITHFLWNE